MDEELRGLISRVAPALVKTDCISVVTVDEPTIKSIAVSDAFWPRRKDFPCNHPGFWARQPDRGNRSGRAPCDASNNGVENHTPSVTLRLRLRRSRSITQ